MYSVTELQNIINSEIQKRSDQLKKMKPVSLYSPAEYSLGVGGKRLRPVLLLLGCNMFSDNVYDAIPAAIAIEVFHNFTLLHDDIMDKAEVRRNKPTVHKKFGESNAILSGDAMAFLAYKYLLECKSENTDEVISLFTATAIEVCEGQQYDMDFEKRFDVSEAEYIEMIRLKTAVLLGCALKTGALLANAGNDVSDKLYELGINLGLAFQLQDDLLDSFGSQESFGKKIGGDILANKKTFLSIKALEKSDGIVKTTLIDLMNSPDLDPDKKISEIIGIYNKLEIRELTEKKIEDYFNKCNNLFKLLPVEESRKEQLLELSKSMLNRIN